MPQATWPAPFRKTEPAVVAGFSRKEAPAKGALLQDLPLETRKPDRAQISDEEGYAWRSQLFYRVRDNRW